MSWFDAWRYPRPRAEALTALERAAGEARNPSSPHGAGRAAKREIDRLTETLLGALGLNPRDYELIITGSGAEAMRIALQGARGHGHGSSTALRAANRLAIGGDVRPVALWVDENSGRRHEPVAAPMVDGTCGLGRAEVPCAPHLLALCGARSGGPPGIGALVRRKGEPLAPLWGGGGQEHGLRSGTQAVPLAAGWCAALHAPSRRDWLRDTAEELAQTLDRAGCEILVGADARADGVVVAAVPPSVPAKLRAKDLHPAKVTVDGREALRFAVDAADKDDDIEELLRAIGTG